MEALLIGVALAGGVVLALGLWAAVEELLDEWGLVVGGVFFALVAVVFVVAGVETGGGFGGVIVAAGILAGLIAWFLIWAGRP